MNKHLNKSGPHCWQPGESGNRNGRPLGARQKIAEKLLADISDVWEAQGKAVLERLANGQWPSGQTGNASGQPLSARSSSERLLSDLADVCVQHGKAVSGVLDAIKADAEPAEFFEWSLLGGELHDVEA